MVPGKGSTSLFVGQSADNIREVLGEPDWNAFRVRHAYYYYGLGLKVTFGDSKTATLLSFYRKGLEGHDQSQAITPEGLRPGMTRSEIVAKLGKADRIEPGSHRNRVRQSDWYTQGVAFEFSLRGIAEVMIICTADTRRSGGRPGGRRQISAEEVQDLIALGARIEHLRQQTGSTEVFQIMTRTQWEGLKQGTVALGLVCLLKIARSLSVSVSDLLKDIM